MKYYIELRIFLLKAMNTIGAFELKTIIRHCPVQPSDHYRTRPTFLKIGLVILGLFYVDESFIWFFYYSFLLHENSSSVLFLYVITYN